MFNCRNQVSFTLASGRGEVGVEVACNQPKAVPVRPGVQRQHEVRRRLGRDVDRREAAGAAGLVARSYCKS
eukprot:11742533-Alexandrium_andersonii.AAC.1